jgi:hypothetical protein
MNYTTECIITTSSSSIDVIYIESVIDTSSSIAENSFVIKVPDITIDTSVIPGVTEIVLSPENSFIDVNANLSVQEYIVSFAPQEIPNNLEAANTPYISYQQISGTVTSTVQDYSTYTLSAFENVPISSIDNVQFNATAPVIVGTGTNFIADFSGGDVFVANNEYFIVQAVFGATNLVIDRSPITPFTNVVAYKINP